MARLRLSPAPPERPPVPEACNAYPISPGRLISPPRPLLYVEGTNPLPSPRRSVLHNCDGLDMSAWSHDGPVAATLTSPRFSNPDPDPDSDPDAPRTRTPSPAAVPPPSPPPLRKEPVPPALVPRHPLPRIVVESPPERGRTALPPPSPSSLLSGASSDATRCRVGAVLLLAFLILVTAFILFSTGSFG
eukprot:Sspe_Gene.110918::Locus_92049_Transcript_3_3_Confidence_0.571_Length_675::g.110918::m.110918